MASYIEDKAMYVTDFLGAEELLADDENWTPTAMETKERNDSLPETRHHFNRYVGKAHNHRAKRRSFLP